MYSVEPTPIKSMKNGHALQFTKWGILAFYLPQSPKDIKKGWLEMAKIAQTFEKKIKERFV